MANILHKIKAILFLNWLTDDPNDYAARVVSERSLNIPEICNSAVNRGGAATTAEAMEHNVNLFFKEMGYQLCDGYSVNTGYFTASTLIKGVFNSSDETFNGRNTPSFSNSTKGKSCARNWLIFRGKLPVWATAVLPYLK